jgi:hypothetical protein
MIKVNVPRDLISYIVINLEEHPNIYGAGKYLGFDIVLDKGTSRVVRFLLPDDIGIRTPSHLPTEMKLEDLGL